MLLHPGAGQPIHLVNMSIIDPSTINPLVLPSVSLEQRAALPSQPCVYFAIDKEGKIQYIGKAANPRKRWQAHHRGVDLALMGGVRIAYLEVDISLLAEIESILIANFRPPLNWLITAPKHICVEPNASSKTRRHRGQGSGSIHWKPITRGNKIYPQAWYHYEIWDKGTRSAKKSKYIPKHLVGKIQELELEKAPVKEILKVLGAAQ